MINKDSGGAVGSDYDPRLARCGANGPSGPSGGDSTEPAPIGVVGSDYDDHTGSRGANGPSGPAR